MRSFGRIVGSDFVFADSFSWTIETNDGITTHHIGNHVFSYNKCRLFGGNLRVADDELSWLFQFPSDLVSTIAFEELGFCSQRSVKTD